MSDTSEKANTGSVAVEPQGPPELSFEPFVPWWFLLALALGAMILMARSYRRTTRPLSVPRRVALWALRVSAALMVLWCLARPVMVESIQLRERGLCFIALDASASMNLRDGPENLTRWAYAGRIFARHQDELAQLGKRFELRRMLFETGVRDESRLPGESAAVDQARPAGRATDMAGLLERTLAQAGGTPCAGALLIGDGRHNTPGDPLPLARRLASVGVPLFVVGVGRDKTPDDYRELNLKLLEAPERAFVRSRIVLSVEVEAYLPEARTVPLTVQINDEEIFKEMVKFEAGHQLIRREVEYVPTKLGVHRAVASVPLLPDEPNVNNNVRATYFRVFRARLGVLYLEGAIRKEFGALRSALETAPNVQLNAVNAVNAFIARREAGGLLPEKPEAWSELKLVILGDLPASRFRHAEIERLAQFVADGGSVLMIGGIQNFGLGGWHETPLAKVLPVEMTWSDGSFDGPLSLSLTTEGAFHPAARLAKDPEASRVLWSQLPSMPGVNGVGRLKPAATTLINANSKPLLVVQDFGKGRSAAFTGDATWQWVLKAGLEDAHRHFWRSLATWLTRSDYRDADRVVFVETDRMQYLLGEEVEMRATVQETPEIKGILEGATVRASLQLEGGVPQKWALGSGVGEYTARRAPQVPGTYLYRTEVLDSTGRELGHDEMRFQVDVLDLENDNPRANLTLLRRLAEQSGGAYFEPDEAGGAFQRLLQRPEGYSKVVRTSTELWNHWSVLLFFVGALAGEWLLRRRWGLN